MVVGRLGRRAGPGEGRCRRPARDVRTAPGTALVRLGALSGCPARRRRAPETQGQNRIATTAAGRAADRGVRGVLVCWVHGNAISYCDLIDTVTTEVSTRELRSQLSDVLGCAMYAGERIGVTRNGKLAAVVVSVADLEALEEFEMVEGIAAYRRAQAEDDGGRVTLDALRADLASWVIASSSPLLPPVTSRSCLGQRAIACST